MDNGREHWVLEYVSGSIRMVVARMRRRADSGMHVGCVQGDTQQAGDRWLAKTGMVAAEVACQGTVARVAVALVSGQGVRWDPGAVSTDRKRLS